MNDDEVFDAVAELVAAGEYLDIIPGRPNFDLEGRGTFMLNPGGLMQRRYLRGSPRYLEAKARGGIESLPPLQPASIAAVEEVEEVVGTSLPPLLRRLYLEVGNGGFGPGNGLGGLRDGHHASSAIASLEEVDGSDEGPLIPMLLCHWGCGITSTIDLADGQIWGYDPNPGPANVPWSFPQHLTITDWFARWLKHRLYQPWLTQDPISRQWRGATDSEYEEVSADFEDG